MRTNDNVQKLNNSGFSLVELIVTVLIMSLVSGMIVTFILTSKRSYEVVNTATELQTESEVASTFIKNVAIEARKCGEGSITNAAGRTCAVVWFLGPDVNASSTGVSLTEDEGWYYYFIVHDIGENALRYHKVKESTLTGVPAGDSFTDSELQSVLGAASGEAKVLGNPYKLLAEYMDSDVSVTKALKLTKSTNSQGTLVTVDVRFKFNGETYPVQVKAVARNMK